MRGFADAARLCGFGGVFNPEADGLNQARDIGDVTGFMPTIWTSSPARGSICAGAKYLNPVD